VIAVVTRRMIHDVLAATRLLFKLTQFAE